MSNINEKAEWKNVPLLATRDLVLGGHGGFFGTGLQRVFMAAVFGWACS